MWGGDPTLASPHRTRHTRLGASSQGRSFPSTLLPEAQPWGKESDTNPRRQGGGWGQGGPGAGRQGRRQRRPEGRATPPTRRRESEAGGRAS